MVIFHSYVSLPEGNVSFIILRRTVPFWSILPSAKTSPKTPRASESIKHPPLMHAPWEIIVGIEHHPTMIFTIYCIYIYCFNSNGSAKPSNIQDGSFLLTGGSLNGRLQPTIIQVTQVIYLFSWGHQVTPIWRDPKILGSSRWYFMVFHGI